MILLTGATGLLGKALLPMLLEEGHQVRALVRDPRRLGMHRVDVGLSLADLGTPPGLRQAVRGVDTVIHLAATIRDQPPRRLEEVNGIGTLRLVQAAERAGVKRFIFASAIGATEFQRTRFFRSKALAERAVEAADMEQVILAPSIIYGQDDPWITTMRRLTRLPAIPISGSGEAAYEPIWVRDAARATMGALDAEPGRYELAGPERLTYDEIARLIASVSGSGGSKPLLHVPLPIVRRGLLTLRRMFGEAVFATWEEAELMEVPMVSERGTADAEQLGAEPAHMRAVLGAI